jgi:hypothetical protein
MDFTHARVLIVGLLPLSVVVALILADLRPSNQPTGRAAIMLWLMAAILAGLLVLGIEWIARTFPGSSLVQSSPALRVRHEAIARIGMSFVAVACLLVAIRGWSLRQLSAGRVTHVRNFPMRANTAYWALGLAIGLQTFVGADYQINGTHTHTGPPFLAGNNYHSTKASFRTPTPDAIAALGRRLDNDNYRSVLLCDPNIAGGFCAGHVPEFWRLRVIDGYYGLGVPKRLAALPWRFGLGLRTISHLNPDHLYWPILGLLNVKYAVKVDEALYRNNRAGPGEVWRPPSPDDVRVEINPLPVVPRYYFARNAVPVAGVAQAASKLFDGDKLVDVTETSFVENFSGPATYSGIGAISATGSGDHVKVTVEPAPVDRFLVANELYFPGWDATVDGKATAIYPTNAVMRGIVVPAGATTIDFSYTPFVRRGISFAFYGFAFLLVGVGGFVFGRPPLRR